jgi:hypothetical protein
MKQDRVRVMKAAAALANARGMRKGLPAIRNILDMLPQSLREEIIEDAEEALEAAGLAELQDALEGSVNLQAHYAALLNQHDGGERTVFTDVKHWMARLRELDEHARKKQPDTERGSATKGDNTVSEAPRTVRESPKRP